jgi:phosphoribosylformylglycinamidine cyclo-ligase
MANNYQDSEALAVDAIKKAIPPSLKQDMLKESKGMFAELYQNNIVFPNHYIASAIDGVGTKVIVAEAMKKYDTIGTDCVAVCANDIATLGAVSPFLFMDAILCQSKIQEQALTGDIAKGMSRGLEQCDSSNILKNSIKMNFGKGETASVNELLSSSTPGYGLELIGSMVGFILKDKFAKHKVKPGDKIIALKSSGPHCNGYTDLRMNLLNGDFERRAEFKKKYKGSYGLDSKFDGSTIGKLLLEPTRIYVQEMARISKEFDVTGINNTGYGLKNFNRIKENVEFRITNPINPQLIFGLMQRESGFKDEQMYTTFNMGMGFFIVCNSNDSEKILNLVNDAYLVGEVNKSSKTVTVLQKGSNKIVLEGY